MDFFATLLWVIGAANLALALIVLRPGSRRETNRVFALAALSVAVWAFTNAGFRMAGDEDTAVLMCQLSYGAAVTLGSAFLHFSWTYPRPLVHGWLGPVWLGKWLVWLSAVVLAGLAFVPGFMVAAVNLESRSIMTAPGVYLVALHMVVTTSLAFAGFWRHQSRLSGKLQAQARFVLYGSFLTAACGLTCNLALPLADNYRYVWAGPASSIFFVGFSVYSIVTHHLFDIRVLIRRTVMYSMLLAFISVAFTLVEKFVEKVAPSVLGGSESWLSQMIPVLIIGMAFEPLRQEAKRFVKRRLFRREFERPTH